jgi:hypothetical protein
MMANAGTLRFSDGKMAAAKAPKAPPNVAPIKSEGEKMPPDEPEPRLNEVAVSLQTKSNPRRGAVARLPSRTSWIVA